MKNPLIEGIEKSIAELIPDSIVRYFTISKSKFNPGSGFKKSGAFKQAGISFGNEECEFWFELNDDTVCNFRINREPLRLTKIERRILGRLPEAIVGLLYTSQKRKHESILRIAGRAGFEQILISTFLRGGNASTFWVPAFITLQMQDLTFSTYEGAPCTSGFVYTSQPELYLKRLRLLNYEFVHFEKNITVTQDHFAKPAAYRYVDGKNAFYLVDNLLRIHGIIKVKDPNRFSRIDRSNLVHVTPLVETMPGRPWIGCIGNNNDVHVLMTGRIHFVWQKNHWHLVESSLLSDLLHEYGCTQEVNEDLSSVVFALSDLRLGSVLLIVNDETSLPNVVGAIDDTELAKALRDSLVVSKIRDLVKDHSIIGVLSSDGLTTLSRSGRIISCGDIIDISKASALSLAGGGRSQAAIAASYSGLAIKVSEDGPISIYREGKRIIRL